MLNLLKTIFSPRPIIKLSGGKFNLLFALFMLLAYNFPFVVKLFLINPSPFFVIGSLACVLMLFSAAVSLLFNQYTAKPLAVLFCVLNSLVFYFMITYHTPVDKVMFLNVLRTDVYEVQDLVSPSLMLWFFLLGILPSWLILKTEITYRPWRSHVLQTISIVITAGLVCVVIMGIGHKNTKDFFNNHRDAKYYLTPVNYISASISVYKTRPSSDHPFVTIADDAKLEKYWRNNKKNLFVFIVGETARAANFSLGGYPRPTNAPLNKHLKEIVYYDKASACGTSTAVSVPCMFSRDERQNYQMGSEEYTENLLDVLDKTGYKVLWRENNTGCQNNCDRVEIEDFCTKKSCLDEILLTDFAAKVRSTDKNTFVVMHQTGSHGPAYYAHYPHEDAPWNPVCKTQNLSSCSSEELINVYDNTIHYTSKFLSRLMDELTELSKEYNVALFYASDHGESLGENGIYLHAQPYETAPAVQKEIPMLIWLPDSSVEAFGLNRQCLAQNAELPVSHDNLFHSVLGLSGIKTADYKPKLDIFAPCKK